MIYVIVFTVFIIGFVSMFIVADCSIKKIIKKVIGK